MSSTGCSSPSHVPHSTPRALPRITGYLDLKAESRNCCTSRLWWHPAVLHAYASAISVIPSKNLRYHGFQATFLFSCLFLPYNDGNKLSFLQQERGSCWLQSLTEFKAIKTTPLNLYFFPSVLGVSQTQKMMALQPVSTFPLIPPCSEGDKDPLELI